MKFIGALLGVAGLAQVALAGVPRAIINVSSRQVTTNAVVDILFSEAVQGNIVNVVVNGPGGAGSATATAVSNRQFRVAIGTPAAGTYTFSVGAGCGVPTGARSAASNECMTTASPTATVTAVPAVKASQLMPTSNKDITPPDCRLGCPVSSPNVPNPLNLAVGPETLWFVANFNGPITPASDYMSKVSVNTIPGGASTAGNAVFKPQQMYFSAKGRNNAQTLVQVNAGAVTDLNGQAYPATAIQAVNLQFAQDCVRGSPTASAWSSCTCAAGSTSGTSTRTITPGAAIGPVNGGAQCASASASTESKPCTCGTSANVCAGRCNEAAPASGCSCGPMCKKAKGGCCADVAATCPANLPFCVSVEAATGQTADYTSIPAARRADTEFCGLTLRTATQQKLCTCDPSETGVPKCSSYDGSSGGGCTKTLCSEVTGQAASNFNPKAGNTANWCTNNVNPKGGSLAPASATCSCAPGCGTTGNPNCCSDYAAFCAQPTKCNGKCNTIIGDLSAFVKTAFTGTPDWTLICLCVKPAFVTGAAGTGLQFCSDNTC